MLPEGAREEEEVFDLLFSNDDGNNSESAREELFDSIISNDDGNDSSGEWSTVQSDVEDTLDMYQGHHDLVVDLITGAIMLEELYAFGLGLRHPEHRIREAIVTSMGDAGRFQDLLENSLDHSGYRAAVHGESNAECPVCLDPLRSFEPSFIVTFDCGHRVCFSCINERLQTLLTENSKHGSSQSGNAPFTPVPCMVGCGCTGVLYKREAHAVYNRLLSCRANPSEKEPAWEWYAREMDKHLLSCAFVACSNERCRANPDGIGEQNSALLFPSSLRGTRGLRRIVTCGCWEETCYDPIDEDTQREAAMKRCGNAVQGCGRKAHDPLSCHASHILSSKILSIQAAVSAEVERMTLHEVQQREAEEERRMRTEVRRHVRALQAEREQIRYRLQREENWQNYRRPILRRTARDLEQRLESFHATMSRMLDRSLNHDEELSEEEFQTLMISIEVDLFRGYFRQARIPPDPAPTTISEMDTSTNLPERMRSLLRRIGRDADAKRLESILDGSALPIASEFVPPSTREEQEAASEAMVAQVSKPCPNPACMANVVKDGGCDHMMCKKCRWDFCWTCLRKTLGSTCIHCNEMELELVTPFSTTQSPQVPDAVPEGGERKRRRELVTQYDPAAASSFLGKATAEDRHIDTILRYADRFHRPTSQSHSTMDSSSNIFKKKAAEVERSIEILERIFRMRNAILARVTELRTGLEQTALELDVEGRQVEERDGSGMEVWAAMQTFVYFGAPDVAHVLGGDVLGGNVVEGQENVDGDSGQAVPRLMAGGALRPARSGRADPLRPARSGRVPRVDPLPVPPPAAAGDGGGAAAGASEMRSHDADESHVRSDMQAARRELDEMRRRRTTQSLSERARAAGVDQNAMWFPSTRAELLKWAQQEQTPPMPRDAAGNVATASRVAGEVGDRLVVHYAIVIAMQGNLAKAENMEQLWSELGGESSVLVLLKELALWHRLAYNVALHALGAAAGARYGGRPLTRRLPPLLGSVSAVLGQLASVLGESGKFGAPEALAQMKSLGLVPILTDASASRDQAQCGEIARALDALPVGSEENDACRAEGLGYMAVANHLLPSENVSDVVVRALNVLKEGAVNEGSAWIGDLAAAVAGRLRADRNQLCCLAHSDNTLANSKGLSP